MRNWWRRSGPERRSGWETLAGALSLDAPVSSDADANTLAYYQEDPSGVAALEDVEEQIYQDQLRRAVAEVLAELPEDRWELLRLRFWEDATRHPRYYPGAHPAEGRQGNPGTA